MEPTQKIKLVISDFHLSSGRWLKDGRRNPLEDFHQDERFREMLDYYSSGSHAKSDVELIINGDFFDPLAILPVAQVEKTGKAPEYPLEVEEDAAVKQFKTIMEGHPVAVDGLIKFLKRGKKIIFRWGNHDAAILWPRVQDYLRETLSPPQHEQLEFQKNAYIFDRICIDHGHQYETLNQFDEDHIFIKRKTKRGERMILNLPFGSFFVMGFLNRLKLKRRYINNIYPFRTYIVLTLFIDPLFFLVNGLRVFWFFIKMRFITHPMRFARFRKTLVLMGEIFSRPSLEQIVENMFVNTDPNQLKFDTIILGHNHQATIRSFPNGKQYINTGTWTPITSLDMGSLGHRMMRTYAFIDYVNGKPRATLKIWHGQTQVTDDFA